ncbi:cytochrome bd oxidase small subunit CydS [Paenibacillus rigui]
MEHMLMQYGSPMLLAASLIFIFVWALKTKGLPE